MHTYCKDDCRILLQGVLTFRSYFMAETIFDETKGIDPFDSITISSYINKIFRRYHLKPNTVAIIPKNGYNAKQKVSEKSMLYLKYISEKDNIFIQHAKNLGEKKVGQFYLDGFCETKKKIIEFHGCKWHGCQVCYKSNTIDGHIGETTLSLHNRSEERIKFIKK